MAQKKSTSAAKKSAAKKAPVKKSAPKRAAVKKTAPKMAPAKKSAAKKAPAQKSPAQKAPAKKAPARKAPARKAPAQKATAKRTPAKKAPAKKALAKKAIGEWARAPKAPAAAKKAPPAAKAKTAERVPEAPKPPAPKKAPATSKYSVGDKVVHPQHGAATIQRRVKQTFDGQSREYYVLDISTESLTVMIPVDKVDSVVRSVISKTASKNVLASLKGEPQEAGANWSRWYKVLTEKMYSGDIFQVAEVVRDLSYSQQTKGISPALKRMLSKARMTLISELSFSLEVDEEEATNRLDRALPKVDGVLVPIV
ncbi:MAG: CarD family transcriptional regulator [bacterium]